MKRRHFLKKIIFYLTLPLTLSVSVFSCFSIPIKIKKTYQSDHFDGKKFFYPKFNVQRKNFSDIMKWRMNRKPGEWPEKVSIHRDIPPNKIQGDQLRVSYVGHASVLIQTEGLNLLFDPQWDNHASPVQFAGPERITPPGIKLEYLPPIDYIFISHNHYDHLSIPTLKKIHSFYSLSSKLPTIIVPLGNKSIIDYGIEQHRFKIIELDWEERLPLNRKMNCVLQPSLHWSARGLSDYNKCLWGAFVMTSDHGNLYFAGDTGFGKPPYEGIHFKETQKKFGKFRLSMLPIGAYQPRDFMRAQHINPTEAVKGAEILKSKYNLGIHLQTFKDLTDESYDAPVIDLIQALKKSSIPQENFKVLKAGQVWKVPNV